MSNQGEKVTLVRRINTSCNYYLLYSYSLLLYYITVDCNGSVLHLLVKLFHKNKQYYKYGRFRCASLVNNRNTDIFSFLLYFHLSILTFELFFTIQMPITTNYCIYISQLYECAIYFIPIRNLYPWQ